MYETRMINLRENFEEGIEAGIDCIQNGKVFAFPTETVYGLGADALKPEAIRDIFALKGRPGDNPLIVHVSSMDMAFSLARLTKDAERLAEMFWPGPLTLVLPKRDCVPYEVTAGLKSVGLRMPDNAAALKMIDKSQRPLAAPSANKSGRPSPTSAQHVYEDFAGEIPLILDGGPSLVGVESTVLLLTGEHPTIVRPGIITPEMIAEVVGEVYVDEAVLTPFKGGATLSPGLKYKHYAPKAHAIMVEGELEAMKKRIAKEYDERSADNKRCLILASEQSSDFYGDRNCVIIGDRENPITLCRTLYDALRQADAQAYDEVILEALPPYAEGLAYMNRALRAVAFELIEA